MHRMPTPVTDLMQFLSPVYLLPSQYGLVIAVSVCFTLLLVSAGVSSVISARHARQHWRRRVGMSRDRDRAAPLALLWKMLLRVGERTKPRGEAELSRVRRTLVQAGYRRADASVLFFGSKLCLTLVLP